MYTVSLSTSKKHWTETKPTREAAEAYRKFAFAKWRAKGVILEPGQSVPVVAQDESAPKTQGLDPSEALVERAHQAGLEAARLCIPTPMVVSQHADPMDDSSPVVRQFEPVMGGVCGFAWVNVKPANCKVAKVIEARFQGRKDSYEGGMRYHIGDFGQSYEKKTAYAQAFAAVLSGEGVRCYASSRLD